jgi:hypothetical protein
MFEYFILEISLIVETIGSDMSQSSSKLNRRLTQAVGIVLGITIAVWVLRGFGVLTFIPGGIILMLLLVAIAIGILSHLQKTWWRF